MDKCKNQFILEGTIKGNPAVKDYETYYSSLSCHCSNQILWIRCRGADFSFRS